MKTIEENHQREQYFFDEKTLHELADFAQSFDRVCCICAPMLGRELHRRGKSVRVLDVDERFDNLAGFRRWDLYRPTHLDEEFDLIVCDPPFFTVSLSQLFTAIRMLCHFDLRRGVMISYPVRRQRAILGTFAPFGLHKTGYRPSYLTVQQCEKNDIAFYANFELEIPKRDPRVTNQLRRAAEPVLFSTPKPRSTRPRGIWWPMYPLASTWPTN